MTLKDPTWFKQLKPGSFRGIGFSFSRVGGRFGRRTAIHDYPGLEDPDTEDLGAIAGQFGIDAYVIGDNYMPARDALIKALDTPGPGVLVHPYRGTFPSVVALEYETEESIDEGGMCHFSITFLKTAPVNAPTTSIDTPTVVANNVAVVKSFQAPALASVNVSQSGDLAEAFAQLNSLIQPLGSVSDQLKAAIGEPATLASAFNALFDPITDLINLEGYFGRTTNAAATSMQSQANLALFTAAFQVAAIIRGCTISAATTYDSYNSAIAARDTLLDGMDGVAGSVDDDTFVALQDLRAAVANDITTRAADLARITSVTLQQSLPALVLAHRLYGPDAVIAASEDIIARNGIINPGFLPSGVPLEVLSDWS